jgi:putative sigma-54 modulation protein
MAAMLMMLGPLGYNIHMSLSGSKLAMTSRNLEITEPLRSYADSKLSKPMERHDEILTSVSLNLKVEHRGGGLHDTAHEGQQAHIAELTAMCKDRQVIRVCTESENMYSSIDDLSNTLSRKLRKYKERRKDSAHDRAVGRKENLAFLAQEGDEDEEPEPMAAPAVPAPPVVDSPPPAPSPWSVVREKKFPMPPMSVADAILCLEYIEHDFYVFRNDASNEINVVYRRNSGGVGLIEPDNE